MSKTLDVSLSRALDKREYLMIFYLFLIETICCEPLFRPFRCLVTTYVFMQN